MAEALGIASGIAGIVSLGITICSGLDTFFSAIKDREDDLKRATELLSLLRRYIELIRPSASTLSSRHAQATDLVVLALGSCEGELRALKELVENLNKADGASDVARKWDKSKSVITYPFQRKKLTQIQDQLLKATGALGTVIQALILHVGVGVGDDIEAFRSAVQDNHLVTTAFLTRIESKVERIEGSAQQTEARLTAISTGVEEQRALASSSQTLIKDTSLMVSGTLDAIAEGPWLGPQSQTVGTVQQKDIPRYLRNSMTERKCIQETTMAICPCQGQKGGTGRQPLTTYRLWGGLAISYQSMSKGDHQPRCCFYKRSTKTTITYTGFRFLFSKVLSFSLQSEYQCGGSLTTHSLQTYNVRETSQALNVFLDFKNDCLEVDLTKATQKNIKKLQIVYTSGKASPLDVDIVGRNVAHMCILASGLKSLKMMLRFLQQVGVNVYAGTNKDGSIIEFVFSRTTYRALGPVYDVLANCESQFDPEQDHERAGDLYFPHKSEFIDELQGRPDILEGLGYRNLFLAVARRDEARIKELIENIKFVEYVCETDIFGQNIVHFCLNWETGLRLLLENEATHHLVSQPDATGLTPLMDALILSGHVCHESYGRDLCSGCGCSATVKLLLETDCPIGLNLIADIVEASPKAKIALLEHLAQRRERLQKLALHHLPESELRVVVHSTAQSRLPCPCATEELSLPLHHLVVALLHDVRVRVAYFRYSDGIAKVVYLVDLLSRITSDQDLAYLVKSIIHVLTIEALRIRHLRWCHRFEVAKGTEKTVQRAKEVKEWDEMLDEDQALIEMLGDLTEEFEQEFSNRNLSIEDFLRLHWRPRMRQVLRQVRRERKAVDESYRKELREIGVVLDDESEQDVYSDSDDTFEWDDDSEDDDSEDDD
ncbi:hypothetical protein NCS56_00764200 [Fusarium sp. Ph1]|nr:hypothetical protein NCS56_00764200 [Fusarium sp. Ph1]